MPNLINHPHILHARIVGLRRLLILSLVLNVLLAVAASASTNVTCTTFGNTVRCTSWPSGGGVPIVTTCTTYGNTVRCSSN